MTDRNHRHLRRCVACLAAPASLMAEANPYATALAGLELADPVAALFDFCRKREEVRVKRERVST